MLHFLDSNILYNDPLMKKSANKRLFDKIESIGGNIFICDIVYKETLNNYRKGLEQCKDEIKKINTQLNKLGIDYINIEDIDIDKEVNSLKTKINEYIESGKFKKIDVNNDILPEVIDRAIKRKKPFSDKKEEFRDCIIWLTYAKKAEEDNLDNCIFITNNTSDFCNKDNELHEDLLEDSKRFRVHKNSYEFLVNEEDLINKLEIMDSYKNCRIEKNNFEKVEILRKIFSEIDSYLRSLSGEFVQLMFNPIPAEYIELNSIDIEYTIKRGINIIDRDICELGDICVEAAVNLKSYNNNKDENYYCVSQLGLRIYSSYIAKVRVDNKQIMEIEDIDLNNIRITDTDCSLIKYFLD